MINSYTFSLLVGEVFCPIENGKVSGLEMRNNRGSSLPKTKVEEMQLANKAVTSLQDEKYIEARKKIVGEKPVDSWLAVVKADLDNPNFVKLLAELPSEKYTTGAAGVTWANHNGRFLFKGGQVILKDGKDYREPSSNLLFGSLDGTYFVETARNSGSFTEVKRTYLENDIKSDVGDNRRAIYVSYNSSNAPTVYNEAGYPIKPIKENPPIWRVFERDRGSAVLITQNNEGKFVLVNNVDLQKLDTMMKPEFKYLQSFLVNPNTKLNFIQNQDELFKAKDKEIVPINPNIVSEYQWVKVGKDIYYSAVAGDANTWWNVKTGEATYLRDLKNTKNICYPIKR